MRKSFLRLPPLGLLGVGCAFFFLIGAAGTAQAEALAWEGTAVLDLGTLPPIVLTGAGTATVNNSAGTGHLETLRIAGGVTGSGVVPVTDPEATAVGLRSVQATVTLGSGTLGNISGALQNTAQQISPNALPVPGLARVCLFFSGCNSGSIDIPLTANDGTAGLGIGGLLTGGGAGAIRISLVFEPWTIKTRTLSNRTDNSALSFPTARGFAHGPASMTSSTALTSGVVQLINPIQVTTLGIPGQNDRISLFASLTIHFVPEPGILLLLGSGIAGLVMLGRHRLRK